MAALTDYLENKLVDFLFRGQAFVAPTTVHVALFTTNPTDVGGGIEVTGGSYARVAITCSLANFAGTQAAASTVASSGASGTTSNNATITFAAPTAAWGIVTGMALFDATTAGNMLTYSALTVSKTVNSGDAAPSFAAAAYTLQLDN